MAAAVGVAMPFGSAGSAGALADVARAAERAGARSLWAADHIVQVREVHSFHPFSDDGAVEWSPQTPWPEVMTTLTWLAAITSQVRIGSCVLVLPQRDPILLAKASATLDALSGGRLTLGIGAGWMREEFEVLGWDFATRGRRMNEAIEVMRRCWQGAPQPFTGEFFDLPDGLMAYPTPAQADGIPLLIGGMSKAALRRAGRLGDGWLALEVLSEIDDRRMPELVERLGAMLQVAASERGPDRPPLHNVLAIGALQERHLPYLKPIAQLGFDEIVIDATWEDPAGLEAQLRDAAQALS